MRQCEEIACISPRSSYQSVRGNMDCKKAFPYSPFLCGLLLYFFLTFCCAFFLIFWYCFVISFCLSLLLNDFLAFLFAFSFLEYVFVFVLVTQVSSLISHYSLYAHWVRGITFPAFLSSMFYLLYRPKVYMKLLACKLQQ